MVNVGNLTRKELQSRCKDIKKRDPTVRCNATNVELVHIIESHEKESLTKSKTSKPKASIKLKQSSKKPSIQTCLRDLNSDAKSLTPAQSKACLALIEKECVISLGLPTSADRKCSERRPGSKAIGFHGGKLCCANVGTETPLQASIRTLSLCVRYLERALGLSSVRRLVAKLRSAAKKPIAAMRQLIASLIQALKLGWKSLANPRMYGMLAIAACILAIGWTASTFGDWASQAHGAVNLGPGVIQVAGKWDANAAAAMSRAVENTAATNKVVAQTAALKQVERTFETTASVYVNTKRDTLIMGSLQVAAHTLLPPGMASSTVCGVMLFTKMLQDPEMAEATKLAASTAVNTTAPYASAMAGALQTGAGYTAYALGWFAWNVLIASE